MGGDWGVEGWVGDWGVEGWVGDWGDFFGGGWESWEGVGGWGIRGHWGGGVLATFLGGASLMPIPKVLRVFLVLFMCLAVGAARNQRCCH